MNTPTPRTDAVYLEHRHWANEDEATEAIEDLRDLARELEQELAAERARLDYMSNCGFEHLHNETGDHLGHEWTISGYGESRDVTLRDVIDAEYRADELRKKLETKNWGEDQIMNKHINEGGTPT